MLFITDTCLQCFRKTKDVEESPATMSRTEECCETIDLMPQTEREIFDENDMVDEQECNEETNLEDEEDCESDDMDRVVDANDHLIDYSYLNDSDTDVEFAKPNTISTEPRYKPRIVGEILKKDVQNHTVPKKVIIRQSISDYKVGETDVLLKMKISTSEGNMKNSENASESIKNQLNNNRITVTKVNNVNFSSETAVKRNITDFEDEIVGIDRSPVVPKQKHRDNSNLIVKWNSNVRYKKCWKYGSGRDVKTNLVKTRRTKLRSSLKHNGTNVKLSNHNIVLQYDSLVKTPVVRSHHSRNSSVISRTSSRHGRIIRLEQKATKVLGVVFFTFVILWAPFFVLNLVPTICEECERNIPNGVFDFATWLGYASSMVNPIFYTIFNKVFRDAFRKVLLCRYKQKSNLPRYS
ncbi:hypothetical protein RUM44_004137 [Polyplax serrata]|uniref:G-protein coupled receptors family 1 profile domain-containing protein n=1 Tax=Polyplax serrata TaxID=468196 RepID=A0ABR1B206_POLSC